MFSGRGDVTMSLCVRMGGGRSWLRLEVAKTIQNKLVRISEFIARLWGEAKDTKAENLESDR